MTELEVRIGIAIAEWRCRLAWRRRNRRGLCGAKRQLSGLFGEYTTGNSWPMVGQCVHVDGHALIDHVLVDGGAVDDAGDGDELLSRRVGPRADAGDQQGALRQLAARCRAAP